MKLPLAWETITTTDHSAKRIKVPGGWVVIVKSSLSTGDLWSPVFVNDPNHEWEPSSLDE